MFVESAFITREFKEEQIPVLQKITCLSVVNIGSSVVVVNGVTIYPSQKQILIVPDGTFSNVQLEVSYIKKATQLSNKILLIYKKLI
jgi:hypothetical protein